MGLFDILSSAAEALADQGKREKERRERRQHRSNREIVDMYNDAMDGGSNYRKTARETSVEIMAGIPVPIAEENSGPPRWTWTTSSRKVGAAETPWIICSTSVPTATGLREIARTIQKRTWREEEENCGIEIREIQTCLMKSAGIGIR